MMAAHDLDGRRILVVEDETLIAVMIEETLSGLGCVVVGPASRVDAALDLAREALLDAAILDVTIRGGLVFPVAEVLRARGVPYVLASGYGEWSLPEAMRGAVRLTKPFSGSELAEALRSVCPPAGGAGAH